MSKLINILFTTILLSNILLCIENKKPNSIHAMRVLPLNKLKAPALQELRGAIRGVTIKFAVKPTVEMDLKYELLNPPQGMKMIPNKELIGTHLPDGLYIQWDIPMDTIEGQVHTITVKATDNLGRASTLNFDINVPRTSIIKTKVINNELVITDKNSSLYGMKMKGHNGEDISNMELRSVAYADVWRKYTQKLDLTKEIKYTVFIIDNMPDKLDIKFPEYMDTYEKRNKLGAGFDRYNENAFIVSSSAFWKWKNGSSYLYEDTNGVSMPKKYNKYESEGSKVLIFTINEKL